MLLPPSAYVVLYAAVFLAASIPRIIAAAGGAAVAERFRGPPAAVHLVFMLAYGVYRAMAFHPLFRAGYRKWLETTPWTHLKPLPVGPAHPVPEDALIVAAAGLPLWLAGDVHPITSYAAALAGYLAALSLTFATTGAWGFQFPVVFGLGLALILCLGRPEFSGVAVLATCLIAMIGLRRSFRRWPWADAPSFTYDANKGVVVDGRPTPLGWPYDRLGPRHDPPPRRHALLGKVLWSLLFGWWCYAIECVIGPGGPLFVRIMLVFNMTNVLAGGRVVTMIAGYNPPINLAGRIVRLRPLIPSYDQVFLTPIATIFVAAAGPTPWNRPASPSTRPSPSPRAWRC